jgi:hypothetical protein
MSDLDPQTAACVADGLEPTRCFRKRHAALIDRSQPDYLKEHLGQFAKRPLSIALASVRGLVALWRSASLSSRPPSTALRRSQLATCRRASGETASYSLVDHRC